jgi:hypothetical protein
MLLVLLPLVGFALAQEPAPFTARYLSDQIGLEVGCVVEHAPPHGAWTVSLEVTQPMASGLQSGQRICAIVHSPTFYSIELAGDRDAVQCLGIPGAEPPRFTCHKGGIPSAGQRVVVEAPPAEKKVQEPQRPPQRPPEVADE